MENFRLFIAEQEKTEGSVGLKEQSLSTMKALAATAGTTRGGQPSATEKKNLEDLKIHMVNMGYIQLETSAEKEDQKTKLRVL
jgi:hypothetical protein